MNQTEANAELFKRALVEARLRKAAQSDARIEEVELSEEHCQKMRFILASEHGKKRARRPMTILIAATIAALTVAALASVAIAKKEDIKHFVDDLFGVTEPIGPIDEPRPQEIEKVYSLSYLPNGFEIVNTSADLKSVRTEWQNLAEEYILLEQSVEGFDGKYGDIEGRREQIRLGEAEIECLYTDSVSVFIWRYDGYDFKLECSNELPVDEIMQMIIAFLNENLNI